MWTETRRKVLVKGAAKRSIVQDHGMGHQVLAKNLVNPEPPDHQVGGPRQKPKLGEFLGVIGEILEADTTAPVKQRHSGRRDLRAPAGGYTCGITQVREVVAQARRYSKEVFVPLSHPPGRTQFDFGEATVVIAGVTRKTAVAVITLPYSD
jgi:hypothetical protein